MKLLSEIARELRAKHGEKEIVQMIKNREVIDIEKNGYTTQQNYPNGVYVWASGEDLDGIMFGSSRAPTATRGTDPERPQLPWEGFIIKSLAENLINGGSEMTTTDLEASDERFIGCTIGLQAIHCNYTAPKLVSIDFYEKGDKIILKAVSGHNMARMIKSKNATIPREQYEDRPDRAVDKAIWALSLCGWEI